MARVTDYCNAHVSGNENSDDEISAPRGDLAFFKSDTSLVLWLLASFDDYDRAVTINIQ